MCIRAQATQPSQAPCPAPGPQPRMPRSGPPNTLMVSWPTSSLPPNHITLDGRTRGPPPLAASNMVHTVVGEVDFGPKCMVNENG